MRYQMRQKLLCLGDDYVIRDGEGNEAYYVDGRVFSIGDKLAVRDREGREVAEIRQKLLAWGPTYEVWREGNLAGVVRKELFTFFKCRFEVDVPGPADLEAVGDFMDMEYSFRRGGEEVARVSKRFFSIGDTYGVDVADGEDEVLVLAAAVVIDLVCHPDGGRHR
jgi:uncharacterized protein YxjI